MVVCKMMMDSQSKWSCRCSHSVCCSHLRLRCYRECSPSLQVNGVKQLSLEVPTTTAEDALALEEFLLQRALDQELLQSPPLRVVIAPNNRLINFVTK